MGTIQSSVNQAIVASTALANLNPAYRAKQEIRQKANELESSAFTAQKGLSDIVDNAKKGNFEKYAETQLSDVEARVKRHNESINAYRTALEDPRYKKILENSKYKDEIGSGSKYREDLRLIESKLSQARGRRQTQPIEPEQVMAGQIDISDRMNTQHNNFMDRVITLMR